MVLEREVGKFYVEKFTTEDFYIIYAKSKQKDLYTIKGHYMLNESSYSSDHHNLKFRRLATDKEITCLKHLILKKYPGFEFINFNEEEEIWF